MQTWINLEMSSNTVEQTASPPSDTELLTLFHSDTNRAWRVFVDRYADLIFSQLRRLGFDYDQTMDRFVYICEKLAEGDCRRLKKIRYAGSSGDLIPWIRQVVHNLSVAWVWSEEGRKRLLKPIARLPEHERRVFELYFWRGLSPSAIHEQLRLERPGDITLADVLEALEHISSQLSQKKLWRLLSNLAKTRGTVSLDEMSDEMGIAIEPADEALDPEQALIQKESDERLSAALAGLPTRERLVVQLRYEEGMEIKEITELLHLNEHEVRRLFKAALGRLRQAYK